jgi:hypothetical protein
MSIEIILACIAVGVFLNIFRELIVRGLSTLARWIIKLFAGKTMSV